MCERDLKTALTFALVVVAFLLVLLLILQRPLNKPHDAGQLVPAFFSFFFLTQPSNLYLKWKTSENHSGGYYFLKAPLQPWITSYSLTLSNKLPLLCEWYRGPFVKHFSSILKTVLCQKGSQKEHNTNIFGVLPFCCCVPASKQLSLAIACSLKFSQSPRWRVAQRRRPCEIWAIFTICLPLWTIHD